MWESDANLLSSIRITNIKTTSNIAANPERLFRYYVQSGNPKEPLPIYLDSMSDGSWKVAWSDGTNVYVTTPTGSTITYPGSSVRGFVAHDDGTVAFLVKQGTLDFFLVKMNTAGNEVFKATIDNRAKDFSLGGGRLQYGAGIDGVQKYAAYYKVHEGGHEGDAYQYITADGASVTAGWSWGCSHSMEERLVYNPTIKRFGPFCLSDAYPSHGYHYEHRTKSPVFTTTAAENGYVAGGLGGVVATSTGWLVTFTCPQDGGPMTTNTDVGLIHLAHESGVFLSTPKWLTNTPNIWEMGAHLAKFSQQTDRYLVGWIEKLSNNYFDRSNDKYMIAVINSAGDFLQAPEDISSKAIFHERADFITFPNGDVGWVASWSGTPPNPSYSAQAEFNVVKLVTSCSPNPCSNPPECYQSPGVCDANTIICSYPTKSPKGTPCQNGAGECDNGVCDLCLSNQLICPGTAAPFCKAQVKGSCRQQQCVYEQLAASGTSCPGGLCNAQGKCTGDCNDPNCEQCDSTAVGTCTACTNNMILQNGCCLVNNCLKVDGVGSNSGDYIETGVNGNYPYYYNAAARKYLTFYCCGWGWSITNSATGGSASYISDDATAATPDKATSTWRGGKTVTITKCDLCAGKTCDTPPPCYTGPGTCNQCAICDYQLMAAGTACTLNGNAGTCDGLGGCGQTAAVTPSPTPSSPTPSPTVPTCPAEENWPATAIGVTEQLSCLTTQTGSITRTCNAGGVWGGAVDSCVQIPTCTDGTMNGLETGIDCGGTSCSPCLWCDTVNCGANGMCNEVTDTCDCSGSYTGARCEIPPVNLCTNINCGSYGNCDSNSGTCICTDGWTGAQCHLQPYGTCTDGIKNGDEAGVDCGGTNCTSACKSYVFAENGYGKCSVDCGKGTQSVAVVCMHPNGMIMPNDTQCIAANAHPISSKRECVKSPCAVYTWVANAPWGECSQTCNVGIQTRPIQCHSSIGDVLVDPSKCDPTNKPIETQTCNNNGLTCTAAHWVVSGWGECDRSCGGGNSNRAVFCVDTNGNKVNIKECAKDTTQYTTDRACNLNSCEVYAWENCPLWEPCTSECGGGYGMLGVQYKDVFCRNSKSVVVDPSKCDLSKKPNNEKNGCNPQPCTRYNWMADGPWGPCTNGQRIRTFHCHAPDGANAPRKDCIDAAIPLPPATMNCQENVCPTIFSISSACSKVLTLFQYFIMAASVFLSFLFLKI